MNRLWFAFSLAAALAFTPLARAQTTPPTPSQIQNMIAAGQETQAVQALQNVLQLHPKSGVAWYLLAEAYDAQNDKADAGNALNMASRYEPGLPFANQQDLAKLRAHIGGRQHSAGPGGGHIAFFVIGGLVLLMIILRFLPGRGMAGRNYGYSAPPPPPGVPPYGYGYGPQPGGGMGGMGIGGTLLGGLAAGAGFAAGERIIDGMTGQRGGPMMDPNYGQQGMPDPSRDDGLMGNPGWDGSGGGADDDNLNNDGWS